MGLKKSLRLCDPVDTNNPDSVRLSVSVAIYELTGDAQYNNNSPNNQVTQDCKMMTSTSNESPLDGLTKYIVNKYDLSSNDCIENDPVAFLRQMQETSWTSDLINDRLWQWQTCMEFGYVQGFCRSVIKTIELYRKII